MSAVFRLREDAEQFERHAETLTARIEDAERQIVELRHQRDEARLHRAEAMAAAQVLDDIGFRVDRDLAGIVTVHVDPKP